MFCSQKSLLCSFPRISAMFDKFRDKKKRDSENLLKAITQEGRHQRFSNNYQVQPLKIFELSDLELKVKFRCQLYFENQLKFYIFTSVRRLWCSCGYQYFFLCCVSFMFFMFVSFTKRLLCILSECAKTEYMQ